MDFKKLCAERYSVRAYKSDALGADDLAYIKDCVRLSPSAVNRQPWRFLFCTGADYRERLQRCYDKEWFRTAPAYVLALGNRDEAWIRRYDGKNHADVDLSIAIEHLCLAAAERGLGTCWVCNFDVSLCSELFGLDGGWYPMAIVPIGVPLEEGVPEKKRKSVEDIWVDL